MNGKVVFKSATENDFEDILRLEAESFNLYDRLDRETLIDLFEEFRKGFYTIAVDGVVAGYSVFLIEDGAGYIESIAISNKYRRRGLGQLALKFMLKCIIDMGIKDINLHVRMDNMPAMSLYEKEGFAKEEIVPGFYKDGESAYLYSKKEKIVSNINIGVN